ncbi:MAG: hypothetical protein OCC45_13375 [Desulfotalea sp.]
MKKKIPELFVVTIFLLHVVLIILAVWTARTSTFEIGTIGNGNVVKFVWDLSPKLILIYLVPLAIAFFMREQILLNIAFFVLCLVLSIPVYVVQTTFIARCDNSNVIKNQIIKKLSKNERLSLNTSQQYCPDLYSYQRDKDKKSMIIYATNDFFHGTEVSFSSSSQYQ